MDTHLGVISRIEPRVIARDDARRQAMRKPLPDRTREAVTFLERVGQVEKMAPGAGKDQKVRALVSDKASLQELGRLRQSLIERYGSGQTALRQSLESDPGLKAKSAADRKLVLERVTTVIQAAPVLTQMGETLRQRDRALELGKDNSRGIER